MAGALHTVEATGFGRFMRESLYAYPVAETVHIAGLALLFGSIVLVDLRLLGFGARLPIAALARYAVPWSIAGFLAAAASGLAMFTAHAAEFIAQPVFLLKMGLILAAGVNAAMLHTGALHGIASDRMQVSPRMRLAGALSIVLWLGAIACGRMVAYL